MKKRRRLLPSSAEKSKIIKEEPRDNSEVWTARGRLKGALMDVLDPSADDTDSSSDHSPVKKEREPRDKFSVRARRDLNTELNTTDTDDSSNWERKINRKQNNISPPRQSYVMKLFDRSVDLAQFKEDSPLYPICRAWMTNQPKSVYSNHAMKSYNEDDDEDSVQLPGPTDPVVPRVPPLIPAQEARCKDNINLNYREAPPPSRDSLLRSHLARWQAVRTSWMEQCVKYEARYQGTQDLLNNMNMNYGSS